LMWDAAIVSPDVRAEKLLTLVGKDAIYDI